MSTTLKHSTARPRKIPKPVPAALAKPGRVVPLSDGRAQILIGGVPSGTYANESAADQGLGVMKRLGVAS